MRIAFNDFAVLLGDKLPRMTDKEMDEATAEVKRTCDGPGGRSPNKKSHPKLAKRQAKVA